MNQPDPHVDHVQAVDGEMITLHRADDVGTDQLVLAITDPADQIVSEPRLDPATARALGTALIAFADHADRMKLDPITDRAVAIGQHLNAIALNDPAYRHTIGDHLARLWSEGDYVPEETSMDVHVLVTKRGSGS